jgi:hypothetical protein
VWTTSECCARCGSVGDHFRHLGDLIEVAHRNFDHHLYLPPFVIEVNRELGYLVEAPLERFGCLVKLEAEFR